MPVLRLCGGSVSMRCSPNRMRPASSSQNPATMRSSVVLPQPDGPSSVKNSPSRTAIDTSSTARTVPKRARDAVDRDRGHANLCERQRVRRMMSWIFCAVSTRFSTQASSS